MDITQQLEKYIPYNEQEEKDRQVMLDFLKEGKDCFLRENRLAHFTASSWIVNKDRDKVLLIYHNIYDSWAWTGGHADGNDNLLEVAIKEAKEETGLQEISPVFEDIFSIETITVDGHYKRGAYVPSHLHLNVTYLLEADDSQAVVIKADENSGVKWFSVEEVEKYCSEPWMIKWIYDKLIEKVRL